MKSIDKLREMCKYRHLVVNTSMTSDGTTVANLGSPLVEMIDDIIGNIEAEIAANYLELPKDADGVPIHVGDAIMLPNGNRDNVRFITIRKYDTVFNECGWVPSQCTHVKPRTLEGVLHDFANEAEWEQSPDSYEEIERKLITIYANEIRKLLGLEIKEPDTIRNELEENGEMLGGDV